MEAESLRLIRDLLSNSGTILSKHCVSLSRVTPMFEVPSRDVLDGTSFGVKLCLRRRMVELMGESGSGTAIPPCFTLT